MKTARYGWRPDLPDIRDLTYAASPDLVAALPAHVDLSTRLPDAYDQSTLGACTGNAIAAAVQYDHIRQNETKVAPSRLFIYFNERSMEGTINEDAGAHIRDGIKSLNTWGVCDETIWPYAIEKFKERPSVAAYTAAAEHRAVSYRRLDQTLAQLKGCLAGGFPFVFGFTVYDSFESQEVAKTGVLNMPTNEEAAVGGHAVLAVGYDDSTHRFLVRNSWGKDWGQKGHFTMPYAYLTNGNLSADCWVVQVVK